MKKLTRLLAVLAVLALLASACGSDDDGDTASDDTSSDTSDDSGSDDSGSDDSGSDDDSAMDDDSGDDDAPAEMKTDVGVTDDTIRLGVLTDLTGPFSPLTVPIADGTEAYWEWVNDNGGIAGRMVELELVDTAYDLEAHGQFFDGMADDGEEGVVMIQTSTGSPHTASIRDDVNDLPLATIPLSWNSSWAGESGGPIFEYNSSYCIEGMNGVEWMSQQHGSKVAVISSAGDYGEDGAIGAKMAVEALGLELVYDGQGLIQRGADPTPIVTGIVESGADFVWSTTDPTSFAGIMGGAAQAGYTGQWAGNGPNFNQALLATALAPALDASYTHFGPYPALYGSDSAGMQAVLDYLQEYRGDAPYFSVYVTSFIMGEIARQGLEAAAANGDLTRAGVVEAIQSTTIDMQGLIADINYSGSANDSIPRESFIFDVSTDAYDAEATMTTGGEGADGLTLLEGGYIGDVATGWEYAPCFEI